MSAFAGMLALLMAGIAARWLYERLRADLRKLRHPRYRIPPRERLKGWAGPTENAPIGPGRVIVDVDDCGTIYTRSRLGIPPRAHIEAARKVAGGTEVEPVHTDAYTDRSGAKVGVHREWREIRSQMPKGWIFKLPGDRYDHGDR